MRTDEWSLSGVFHCNAHRLMLIKANYAGAHSAIGVLQWSMKNSICRVGKLESGK